MNRWLVAQRIWTSGQHDVLLYYPFVARLETGPIVTSHSITVVMKRKKERKES